LPSAEPRRRAPRREAGPLDTPFADITLTLEAVLTEMRVPLSRIAAFAPGQTIPIPVARAVPLRVGGAIVARGTAGERADRRIWLPSPEPRRRAPRGEAGPLDTPFADITLTLGAVLTEMRVPLSRIAAFAPGQTIPIPVARAVPLRVGGAIVARGTVGELDDRVALQITNATPSRKDIQ